MSAITPHMDPRMAEVAEILANSACEIDFVANRILSPELRGEAKEVSQRLHRVAMALARSAGVSIYAADDEEDAA